MKGCSDTIKNWLRKSISDLRYFYRNYCGTISGDFQIKIVNDLLLTVPLRAFYFESIKLKSPVA